MIVVLRLSALITLLTALVAPARAQIGQTPGQYPPSTGQYPPGGYPPGGTSPGQYPPGQYPPGRSPYPGGGQGGGVGIPRGRKTTKASKTGTSAPLLTTIGMLRRLKQDQMIVETDDHRVIRLQLSPAVKYVDAKGKDLGAADLKPGDRLEVDYGEDDSTDLTAVHVTLQRSGTAAEREAASLEDKVLFDAKIDPETKTLAGAGEERPHLKRKDAAEANEPGKDTAAGAGATAGSEAEAKTEADEIAPRPMTQVVAAEENAPQGDFGRAPKTKRGKPVQSASAKQRESEEPPAADISPRAAADREKQRAEAPVKVPEYQDEPSMHAPENPVIEKARQAFAEYSEFLPNYMCQQFTTRYHSESIKPDWRAQDTLDWEIVNEEGKERYRNLKHNGKPTHDKTIDDLGGTRSVGEFNASIAGLLDPWTEAKFRYRRQETISHRAALVYSFEVDQSHSRWTVHGGPQSYRPSYKGSLWIDKETSRVMRFEMQSRNMPAEFPFDKLEMTVDYDMIRIGGKEYLLPVHAENLACEQGTLNCSHNVIDYRNYRRFSAESTLTGN